MATARQLRIVRIRPGRPRPGLQPQHLAVVRALAKVSGARVEGDALDSTALTFEPGRIAAGAHRIDIEAIRGSAAPRRLLTRPCCLSRARPSPPPSPSPARAAGALVPVRVRDLHVLVKELKRRGIYTIARVVANDVLARHRPEWALTDVRTGRPWVDNERLAGLDPFREEAWDYMIAVAREAASKGFQEIQFDYLRFPADGELGHVRYSRPSTQSTRHRPSRVSSLAPAPPSMGPAPSSPSTSSAMWPSTPPTARLASGSRVSPRGSTAAAPWPTRRPIIGGYPARLSPSRRPPGGSRLRDR